MRYLSLTLALFFVILVSPVSTQTPDLNVTVNALPQTAAEFSALRDSIGNTPQGGVALLIMALRLYQSNPTEGTPCMIMAVDRSLLVESNRADSYQGFALMGYEASRNQRQLQQHPYLPNSYIRGTSPENGYALPAGPFVFEITRNRYSGEEESGRIKLFIRSSGADSPRPVTLVRNNRGVWKAKEYSSIVVGIRAPASTTDDAL
ncbi:MAG: hypothetical protein H7A21_20520 [Spirochaetales bacterium]|nr:hypothetical protein [Leptospiraceae bacterium]MCP5483836.1 hypothetical protein [Spirochaetales bacterium]MCP5486871.1 hypothetical protein [Spirochaetales bacterium]